LWNCLRANRFEGIKFKRQHSIEWYITDFYCAAKKLVIEVDGDSHFIGNAQEYDFTRTKLLNALDINVVRFRNDEIYNDLENVLDRIKTFISTSPSLPLQRGGE
jgi:very-short-patch-repair endonuclease